MVKGSGAWEPGGKTIEHHCMIFIKKSFLGIKEKGLHSGGTQWKDMITIRKVKSLFGP